MNVAIIETINLVKIEIASTKKFDQFSNHLDKIEIIFQVQRFSMLVLSRTLNSFIYILCNVFKLL